MRTKDNKKHAYFKRNSIISYKIKRDYFFFEVEIEKKILNPNPTSFKF